LVLKVTVEAMKRNVRAYLIDFYFFSVLVNEIRSFFVALVICFPWTKMSPRCFERLMSVTDL
jgi:hypothetical protein